MPDGVHFIGHLLRYSSSATVYVVSAAAYRDISPMLKEQNQNGSVRSAIQEYIGVPETHLPNDSDEDPRGEHIALRTGLNNGSCRYDGPETDI